MGIHWTIIILEYTAHAQSKVVKDWEAWPKKKKWTISKFWTPNHFKLALSRDGFNLITSFPSLGPFQCWALGEKSGAAWPA